MNNQTLSPTETFQERVRERLRGDIGTLLPDDLLVRLTNDFVLVDTDEAGWAAECARLYEICAEAAAAIRSLLAERDALRSAAQAVVDRWDTPSWKDAEPTADVIGKLRAALARRE